MSKRVSNDLSKNRRSLPKTSNFLLGDTPARNYARKLQLFNAFAEPELRQVIATLGLKPGVRALDVGCGTGGGLKLLYEAVGRQGTVVGIDLAEAHSQAARNDAPSAVR